MNIPRAKIVLTERMKHYAPVKNLDSAEVDNNQKQTPNTDTRRRPFVSKIIVEGTTPPAAQKRSFSSIYPTECPVANKRRIMSVPRENKSQETRKKMLYITSSIMRESRLRKQSMAPLPTRVSQPQELKPILKTSNSVFTFGSAFGSSSEHSDTSSLSSARTDTSSADVKCCYRLPDRPPTKLRKSVSFCEDQVPSIRRTYSRQYTSPSAPARETVFNMRKLNDSLIHL